MFRSIKVRDYMNREAVTLSPETHLFQAIDILLTNRLCSAPVVDAFGSLVGVLSESDCLRGILSGAYFEESCGTVRSLMSEVVETIAPMRISSRLQNTLSPTAVGACRLPSRAGWSGRSVGGICCGY